MKMKPYHYWMLMSVMALFMFAAACTSTQKTTDSTNAGSRTLIDYLRRDPAVRVVGNVDNAAVYVNNIQGVTGGGSKVEPLFVLNGSPIGSTYNQAVQLVLGKAIESVKVLKSTVAVVQYGQPGSNGAVVIRTKSTN